MARRSKAADKDPSNTSGVAPVLLQAAPPEAAKLSQPTAAQKAPSPFTGLSPATATADVAVHVNLICGGLTNVAVPIAVGPRYDGLPLAGATKAFDQLLDSWITRAIDLGMIGTGLGQLFPINMQWAQEAGKVKASYLLLAGMGEPGRFAADDLRFLISNIVVAVKSMGHDQVDTPLIDTRRSELPVGDAVRGLIEGILDGFERVDAIASVLGGKDRLRQAAKRPLYLILVDPDEKKLQQMHDAFAAVSGSGIVPGLKLAVDRGNIFDPDPVADPSALDTDPNEPVTLLRIVKNKAAAATDAEPVETELFQFSALSETAAVPVREEEINGYLVREFPDRMIKPCPLEVRQDLGRFFTNCLIPEDFRTLTEGAQNITIEVDQTTAKYPWEMLVHKKYARTSFLGTNVRVSRQFRSLLSPPPSSPPALSNKLKALVIADPAPGRLTLPGARQEGRSVVEVLDQASIAWRGTYDISVKVRVGSPEDATAAAMLEDLRKRHGCVISAQPCDPFEVAMLIVNEQFDIIHYAGHGRFEPQKGRAGWVFGEDCFLTAQEIFRVRQVPRLVFANACFSAATMEESDHRGHLVGLAQAFFARGIPNFIGAGWRVDDDCARECARWFYARVMGLREPDAAAGVIGTAPPATVGDALLEARKKTFEFKRESASWAAYQHYGRVSDKLLPFANAPARSDATANGDGSTSPRTAEKNATVAAASPSSEEASMSIDGQATAGKAPADDPNIVYVNGIDAETGQYAFTPCPIDELAKHVLLRPGVGRFSELHVETPRSFGIPFGMDPSKLGEAGWGIIFHPDTPQDVQTALQPLIEARRNEAGARLKIMDFKKGEQTRSWYQRHGVSAGNVDPEIVPYYLLLVGPPDLIPYEFPYLCGEQSAYGRLAFDTTGEYERYVRSIIAYERDNSVPNAKEIAYWGTRHLGDPATNLSASMLIEPLANGIPGAAGALKRPIHADVGYERKLRLSDDATKGALLEALHAKKPPAMLFTASHGMALRSGQPKQRTDQGALLCQEWPGFGSVRTEHFLAAADIPDDANVNGLVAFVFACFGAGTPDADQFLMDLTQAGNAPPLAPQPFIAALPTRLLTHPNGSALAVIGHIDRAWGFSIQAPKTPDAQIGTFRNSIGFILSGAPIGHAMCGQFGARFAALSTALASSTSPTAPTAMQLNDRDLVTYWLERNDAQNYVMLGDPAVRIRKEVL